MCNKEANSGNTLKPFVLNQIWKYLSGWSNYSGIVISEWIEEMKIGYRGSKSNTSLKDPQANKIGFVFVKEQRADASSVLAYSLNIV